MPTPEETPFCHSAIVAQLADGVVPRTIFCSEEVYRQESGKIFGKCWLLLGHETQVPRAGDFISVRMGETPVILLRDKNMEVKAFINSCRHRGNPVTRVDQGNATSFTCPYHGWCYSAASRRQEAGELINMPGAEDFYLGQLNKQDWGLVPVAQVASYKGLVFGTLDPDAPSLDDYLGDMRWGLDLLLEQGDLAASPAVARWRIGCNWKFAADNAIGDNYHVDTTHRGAFISLSQMYGSPGIPVGKQRPGFTMVTRFGHGFNAQVDMPGVGFGKGDWWRDKPDVMQRLGPLGSRVGRYNMNVFPNLFIIDRLLMVRNPIGPNCTEIRGIALYDRNAPEEVQEQERRAGFSKFGPSGWLEQEDGENWEQATRGTQIAQLQTVPLNYQMALGRQEMVDDGQSPPRIDNLVNEHGQLWFYRFWADALHASSWADLDRIQLKPKEWHAGQ